MYCLSRFLLTLALLWQQTIRKKANDKGGLDSSISAADIAAAVARQMQIEIVPELVDMGGEALGAVGEYEIPLKLILADGRRATLDVSVVST